MARLEQTIVSATCLSQSRCQRGRRLSGVLEPRRRDDLFGCDDFLLVRNGRTDSKNGFREVVNLLGKVEGRTMVDSTMPVLERATSSDSPSSSSLTTASSARARRVSLTR